MPTAASLAAARKRKAANQAGEQRAQAVPKLLEAALRRSSPLSTIPDNNNIFDFPDSGTPMAPYSEDEDVPAARGTSSLAKRKSDAARETADDSGSDPANPVLKKKPGQSPPRKSLGQSQRRKQATMGMAGRTSCCGR
ncbi:hypothetical protein B0H17DRAFT_1128475 [Mycena rosella]|uniref:Uncharacterized protein n=1 Tax=Mycena rosella TaxID=1033263 RepID=A0AAD7GM62_MYCRO|nr:hypothetical protein B0H17DRAFT_1128475 [Mycena rosella]